MINLIQQVEAVSIHSKDASDKHGEVFTPTALIEKMCDAAFPKEFWSDPSKTFVDFCAGNGNMQAVIVTRLMSGLGSIIPDEKERYRHIMEKQVYMAEYQTTSALNIERIFNPTRELHLNLYVGDSLRIPKDFWDLPFEKRIRRYPQHYVFGGIKPGKMQAGQAFARPLF